MLAAMAVQAPTAAAQTYPDRPINIIVPFPPGGADIYLRAVQPHVEKSLGQKLVIQNRAGANGAVGTEAVRRSKSDGYTLLFNVTSSVIMAPLTMADVNFDIQRDFLPITDLLYSSIVLAVRKDLPVNDLGSFIAYIKANPGKVTFSSSGLGSAPHLSGEALARQLGAPMTHVPYKGIAPAVQAIIGGEVDWGFTNSAGTLQHLRKGSVKVLAIAGGKPPPGYPALPDLEKAVPGFENLAVFAAIWAPAGTPRAIIEKLNSVFVAALKSPDIRKRYEDLSLIPAGNSIEATAKAIADLTAVAKRQVEQAKAAGVPFQ